MRKWRWVDPNKNTDETSENYYKPDVFVVKDALKDIAFAVAVIAFCLAASYGVAS